MRLIAIVGIIALLYMLTGCVTPVASAVKSKAETVADTVLASGKYNSCVAPTLGAIEREYSGNPSGLKKLADFCWEEGTAMHKIFNGLAE